MGSTTSSIVNSRALIFMKEGRRLHMAYGDLIDHILLLRQVIANPEITRAGPMLDYFIHEYRKRMTREEMSTRQEQLKLPWQVEWIWHIHRLHPLNYDRDCRSFGSQILLDKRVYNLIDKTYLKSQPITEFSFVDDHSFFVPSIDLVQAVLRQRDFLEKFQNHRFYSHKFTENDRPDFDQLVQNYVSFVKLARTNAMIVPTFDIDLIWHSHMRHPAHYQACCLALCGFVLNHNDSIEKDVLTEHYRKTADQWRLIYNVDYGQNVNREKSEGSKESKSSTQSSGCGGCSSWYDVRFSDMFQTDSSSICSGSDGGDGSCGGCGGD